MNQQPSPSGGFYESSQRRIPGIAQQQNHSGINQSNSQSNNSLPPAQFQQTNAQKTIKKKALLNFRAIKNNFVVKQGGEGAFEMTSQPNLRQTARPGLFTNSQSKPMTDAGSINMSQDRIGGFNSHRAGGGNQVTRDGSAGGFPQPPQIPAPIDLQNMNRHSTNVIPQTANQQQQNQMSMQGQNSHSHSQGQRVNSQGRQPGSGNNESMDQVGYTSQTRFQINQGYSSSNVDLNSQRFKVLNQRLKTRGNVRRFQVGPNNQGGVLAASSDDLPQPHSHHAPGQFQQAQHGTTQSFDRFQNNNIATGQTNKGLVSPRGAQGANNHQMNVQASQQQQQLTHAYSQERGQQRQQQIFNSNGQKQGPMIINSNGPQSVKNATANSFQFHQGQVGNIINSQRGPHQQQNLPALNNSDAAPHYSPRGNKVVLKQMNASNSAGFEVLPYGKHQGTGGQQYRQPDSFNSSQHQSPTNTSSGVRQGQKYRSVKITKQVPNDGSQQSSQPNFYTTGEFSNNSNKGTTNVDTSSHTSQRSGQPRRGDDEASQQTLISQSTDQTGKTTSQQVQEKRGGRNLRSIRTHNIQQQQIQQQSESDQVNQSLNHSQTSRTGNKIHSRRSIYPFRGSDIHSMDPSMYEDLLTNFEKTEIPEYDEVWYMAKNELKYQATKLERLVNNGFDDSEGYYKLKTGDQIAYRFEIIEQIGKGAFGSVIKCHDHKTGEQVAIKMVKNQKKYYYQAAVEAKLLLLLKENDGQNVERVVKLLDYFVWRNHLCLVFELYAINLYEFIKMYDYQGFDYGLIRRFAIQLLSALRYLKQLGIIHCDLKPENILMKQKDKSGIVVADFGSGCLDHEIVYTYIQSRFYRAPDIMLGVFPYSQQIDMWSFGCILIELFTGFPLFPGTNEREQIQLIIDVIGFPNESVLSRSTRKNLFQQFKNEKDKTQQTTAVPEPKVASKQKNEQVLTDSEREDRLRYIMAKLREVPDPSFVNLIARCLEWDPEKRCTPEEGLNHEWILKGLPPGVLQQHQMQFKMQSQGQQNSSSRGQDQSNKKRNTQSQKSYQSNQQQPQGSPRRNIQQNTVSQSYDQGTSNKKANGVAASRVRAVEGPNEINLQENEHSVVCEVEGDDSPRKVTSSR